FLLPILRSDLDGFPRVQALQEKSFELLLGSTLLVFTEQLTDVLAGSAVATFLDSFFDELLEGLWKRDVERGHIHTSSPYHCLHKLSKNEGSKKLVGLGTVTE